MTVSLSLAPLVFFSSAGSSSETKRFLGGDDRTGSDPTHSQGSRALRNERFFLWRAAAPRFLHARELSRARPPERVPDRSLKSRGRGARTTSASAALPRLQARASAARGRVRGGAPRPRSGPVRELGPHRLSWERRRRQALTSAGGASTRAPGRLSEPEWLAARVATRVPGSRLAPPAARGPASHRPSVGSGGTDCQPLWTLFSDPD